VEEKAEEKAEDKSAEEKVEEKAEANGHDAEGDASEEGDAEAKITPSPTKGKTADGKLVCVLSPVACACLFAVPAGGTLSEQTLQGSTYTLLPYCSA
jgi:hypothetical protein